MKIIPQRGLWTQQPQYPRGINFGNSLSKGIVVAWNASVYTQEAILGRINIPYGTGNIALAGGGGGYGISLGTAYPAFNNDSRYDVLGTLSAVALITPNTITNDRSVVAKTTANGATASPYDFGTSTGKIRLGRANATGYRVWASGTSLLSANKTYVIGVSQGSDIGVAPTFYVNGAKDTASPTDLYSGTGSGAATGNSNVLRIGNRDDATTMFSGLIYGCYIFNRVLSDSEHLEIAQMFWKVWKP